ncbi:efflux RND transporter periplasmic adaptor subunit [Labilithrix luteola]|uniref:efflux RND transporter periplasmic adaptor subunit n=1 Tax=Labilithrix luteola TaxID=1391654 RepID=UPI0011BA5823|nr:efflux RND transporter periplasmic adaptor subunit [Labilithrix luteola]
MDGYGLPPNEPVVGTVGASGKRSARVGLIIGLAVAVGFGGLLAVRVKQAVAKRAVVAEEKKAAAARPVQKELSKTVHPTAAKWVPRVDVTGTLKPWREADVGFETSGRLVRVGVSIGDKVTDGQNLAVLDVSRAAAQVGQAESQVRGSEANLALALDNLKRTEALAATKSVPEAQVEQARQQVALAKAQLDGAHASTALAKSGAGLHSISSPFKGIVTKAPTGIGSVVNAGVPLIHIEDTSHFRLSVTVGEEDVPLIANGSKVHVTYRERVVEGKVIAIVPSLDQSTRRAPVEIEVPNDDGQLLAWGFVRARIDGGGETDAVRIPSAARRPGSQDEVVKVENGHVKIAKVSFAVDTDGTLVVQRGLTAADEVVLSPNVELHDGDPIDLGPAPAAAAPSAAAAK